MIDLIALRKKSASFFYEGDIFDPGCECSEAGSTFVAVAEAKKVFESFFEFDLELGEHFGLGPVESLKVLNPLEVTYGDTASVAEDVGDKKDVPALFNNSVGWLGGGSICGFGENFTAEIGCVALGDHALERSRNQNVAFTQKHLIGVD